MASMDYSAIRIKDLPVVSNTKRLSGDDYVLFSQKNTEENGGGIVS